MSLALAMHLDDAVVFASDCRCWAVDADGEVVDASDSHEKIDTVPMGLMTGTGYVSLLDGVKNQIKIERPVQIQGLLEIIAREQQRTNAVIQPAQHARGVPVTGWVLSYVARTEDGPRVRAATYHGGREHAFFSVPAGHCSQLIPYGPGREALELFVEDRLSEFGARFNPEAPAAVRIVECATVLRELIAEASQLVASVSPTCQIGVHLPDDTRWISPILEPNVVLTLHDASDVENRTVAA